MRNFCAARPARSAIGIVVGGALWAALCGGLGVGSLLADEGNEAGQTPASRPNVIVILADDVGYGDVSCNGATRVQTPHIDRLAREGRRFTSGYCSASTCTPTRYSLLTGEYAFRRRGTGIAPPNSPCVIPLGMPTLPGMLRQAGYATAVVGKWHLGLGEPGTGPEWNGRLAPGPLELGFDHCFVLPTTNDRVPQVFVEGHHVRNLDPADPLWVGDTKPAGDHLNGIDHRDQLRMDWSHGHNGTIHNGIGRIGFYTGGTQARFRDEDLAATWAAESVRFIESCVAADPRRPFFLYLASHDIHVPRVAHEQFQGATPLGPRGDCIVQLDWTVGQVLEAVDRLGTLLGMAGSRGRTALVQQDNGTSGRFGYREGKWKLVRLPPPTKAKPEGPPPAARAALYDLEADPGETTDVSDRFPEVAARLARDLDAAVRPRMEDESQGPNR